MTPPLGQVVSRQPGRSRSVSTPARLAVDPELSSDLRLLCRTGLFRILHLRRSTPLGHTAGMQHTAATQTIMSPLALANLSLSLRQWQDSPRSQQERLL